MKKKIISLLLVISLFAAQGYCADKAIVYDDTNRKVKVSDPLPVARGGTGAATAGDARTSLGAAGTTGDETIAGIKTLSSIPVLPASDPTTDNQASRKAYVDTKMGSGSAAGGDLTGTYPNPTIGAGKVITTALKTATGEVSGTGIKTLPGGEYGFYPQVKGNFPLDDYDRGVTIVTNTNLANYTTTVYLSTNSYVQQRYVTASGQDHWLFLLIDKITKDIVSAYSAPDHPAYSQEGDFDNFDYKAIGYDEIKHDLILVDKETISQLKEELKQYVVDEDKIVIQNNPQDWIHKVRYKKVDGQQMSFLTLVNMFYTPDEEKTYQPLHSGKYLYKKDTGEIVTYLPLGEDLSKYGQVKQMIETLPSYIKCESLKKMTVEELQERENKRQLAIQKAEQDKAKKIQDKQKALDKLEDLGLLPNEIEALIK